MSQLIDDINDPSQGIWTTPGANQVLTDTSNIENQADDDVKMESNELDEEADTAASEHVQVNSQHPCQVLNEISTLRVTYAVQEETFQPKGYIMSCTVGGQKFVGDEACRSKKEAKLKAAAKALLELYRIKYDPEAPLVVQTKAAKKRKATSDIADSTEETSGETEGDSGEGNAENKPASEGGGEAIEAGGEGEEDITADGDGEEAGSEEKRMLGKRRGGQAEAGGGPQKKRKKMAGPPEPKNALMHLNELKPGTKFTFVSQSGPEHASVFVMSVEVNNQKFEGQGTSKKLAKLDAAEKALRSFVQFPVPICYSLPRRWPDASTAHNVLGRGFLPYTADFTADANLPRTSNFTSDDFTSDFAAANDFTSDVDPDTDFTKKSVCGTSFMGYNTVETH